MSMSHAFFPQNLTYTYEKNYINIKIPTCQHHIHFFAMICGHKVNTTLSSYG